MCVSRTSSLGVGHRWTDGSGSECSADSRCGPPRALWSRSRLRANTMMAALVMARGTAMSSDGLVSLVWGDEAPRTARNQLHRLVSQTRRLLEPDQSVRSIGSVISEPATAIGSLSRTWTATCTSSTPATEEARVHAAEGRQHESVRAYIAALELARRPAFSGLDAQLLHYPDFVALERERATTASEALGLALGGEVSPRLLKLVEDVAAHAPFDEVLQARFVRTLGRVGRRSDALMLLQVTRERLRDELGLDPGRRPPAGAGRSAPPR